MPKVKSFLRANTVNTPYLKNSNIQRKNNLVLNSLNKKRIEDSIYNLSEDIKKYQHDLKLLGPHHKSVEILYEKILSKLSDNNHEIIQIILNKKKRTNEELIIIKTFLSTMKYLSSMIKIIDTDKILFSLSVYLKMESKNKDSILFRYGSKGRKFYILLSGQVTILLLKETKVQMTFLRYFMHLLQLKMMKEDELVRKTIVANKNFKYRLDERIFDTFYEKLLKYAALNSKNQKDQKEEEKNENEEESLEESEQLSEKENKNKIKELLHNKRNSTIQLNYLCSNFNERMNSKSYKYAITDIIQEEDNIKFDKRISVRFVTPNRQNIINSVQLSPLSNNSLTSIGPPLFYKEEDIYEIYSFYLYLRDSLCLLNKGKISVKDYIRDTYINSNYSKMIKENKFYNKDNFIIYLYYEIVQKNKGDTFGELALQHEDSKRTATILTNTDCILGYLLKNDYESCLSEIELKRRKNEVNFIMSFAIFDQMNWISFENKYFNYFKREYCYQGETILSQGKSINKIYFIMDGQFEITSTLSIVSLYKLIRQKTNYSFQKLKFKLKKNLNHIRLCICNNKDIIGLNDCYFYGALGEKISFVNATCISNKCIAFTIELSILKELQHKMSEINDNLKEIINKREKVMLDRLISIFYQLIKKREINVVDKKKQKTDKNKNNNNKGFILNNNQINYILNSNKNEENYSPYRNVYLSAKYREIRPLSKIEKKKLITSGRESDLLNENIIQRRRIFSTNGYNNKMNLNLENNNSNRIDTDIDMDKIDYKKKITDIMVIKETIPKKDNPRIFLKSAVSIRELNEKNNVKKKLKNLYLPLNTIIHKEYNNLFSWIDYTKKLSESYKKNNYEENQKEISNKNEENKKESEFGNDSKRLSFSSDNNDKDNIINKNENNNFEIINEEKNKNIPLIRKEKGRNKNIRKTLKNLIIEKEKKDKKKKRVSESHDIYDTYIAKKKNKNENNYNDRINIIKYYYNLSNPKKFIHDKKISNELYLKQILGTKYKNQEDEFISKAEKKIIKQINTYILDLKKRNEAKIKFIKKNKELKKLSYIHTDFFRKSDNN